MREGWDEGEGLGRVLELKAGRRRTVGLLL